jgi:hypothetical protein
MPESVIFYDSITVILYRRSGTASTRKSSFPYHRGAFIRASAEILLIHECTRQSKGHSSGSGEGNSEDQSRDPRRDGWHDALAHQFFYEPL